MSEVRLGEGGGRGRGRERVGRWTGIVETSELESQRMQTCLSIHYEFRRFDISPHGIKDLVTIGSQRDGGDGSGREKRVQRREKLMIAVINNEKIYDRKFLSFPPSLLPRPYA